MAKRPLIIGTAGHIDHGKTSLVRALTGVNLDRLPEEQERGITIALGFTQLGLGDGRAAAFVDVPGHEKLVRTMIAGASGLDAVVLVVAANEGVMPQTAEHLAILSLLGLRHGLVVLTKCDLVDEETRELAEMDVQDAVAGTFLEHAPVLTTALGEAPEGLDEVRAAIAQIADDPDRNRDDTACFRLPIDRAFIQRGFGTVVTGTASGAPVRDGTPVWIQPLGLSSRIRGLQVHGDAVEQATSGHRVAANLAGIERDDLARGMVVVADPDLTPASVLDVHLSMLSQAPRIASGQHVRLLIGTAEVLAVADPIGQDALEPGREQLVQLRTESPIVALPGDRFIIRRESPLQTLGGGTVLDPWSRRAKRKHHATFARDLNALMAGDSSRLLHRAGPAGLSATQAKIRGASGGIALSDRRVHPEHIDALGQYITAELAEWHAAHPLEPGAPRRSLHSGVTAALEDKAFDALVELLVDRGVLSAEGPTVRLADFSIALTAEQEAARDAMLSRLDAAGLEGLPFAEMISGTDGLTQLLLNQGAAVRVADQVVRSTLLEDLQGQILRFFETSERLTPGDFKGMTGLSRRTAIPLLEWLDARGVTRRDGDARVAG